MNFSIYDFLFEAPIDVLLKKSGDFDRNAAEELEKKFLSLKNYVQDPSITNYQNFNHLKLTIDSTELAIKEKLGIAEIKWLTKQIKNNPNLTLQNIEEDYIPNLKTYMKNRAELGKIADYKNINDLINKIQEKSTDIEHSASTTEKEILADENGWLLTMPHTTAASCELGSNTTWCTAYTQTRNLFLSYSTKGIILFYIIKENGNPKKNPWDKLSIGFKNGKIIWDPGHGRETVNAANNSLSKNNFYQLLGDSTAAHFIEKMEEKVKSLGGVHPVEKELQRYSQSVKLLQTKLASFDLIPNGEIERYSFIESIINYKDILPNILAFLATDKTEGIRELVAKNKKTPQETVMNLTNDESIGVKLAIAYNSENSDILLKLAKDNEKEVREVVAANELTSPEALEILANDEENSVVENVAKNWSTLPRTLAALVKNNNVDSHIKTIAANNPGTPYDTLMFLTIYGSYEQQKAVAGNLSTRGDLLELLADSGSEEIKKIVIGNKHCPPEILIKYASNDNNAIAEKVASNPNIPVEALEIIAKTSHSEAARRLVAANKKTEPHILTFLAKDIVTAVRKEVVRNANTPPEGLQILAKDARDRDIKRYARERLEKLKGNNLQENINLYKLLFEQTLYK